MEKNNEEDKIFIKDKNKISGGKTKTYNREYEGDGNVIGTNATYKQMLDVVDKLDKSGFLDYLKVK